MRIGLCFPLSGPWEGILEVQSGYVLRDTLCMLRLAYLLSAAIHERWTPPRGASATSNSTSKSASKERITFGSELAAEGPLLPTPHIRIRIVDGLVHPERKVPSPTRNGQHCE